jgi:carbonic anhydrase
MLDKLKPAIEVIPAPARGASSQNVAFVQQVAEKNVELTMEAIRQQSPVLREMLEEGEIQITGGMYDIETGVVTFE